MRDGTDLLSPQMWVIDLFSSRAAAKGGVIRCSMRDIERYVGRDVFDAELRRRGFHAVENAGQLVIFYKQEPIRIVL